MVKFLSGVYKSFHHAGVGILFVLRGRNFRIQLGIAMIVFLMGLYLNLNASEWLVISLTIFMVLSIEALNTAVEEVCNLIKDLDGVPSMATRAPRDIAAGSALLASIGAMIVGLLIFLPKIVGIFL